MIKELQQRGEWYREGGLKGREGTKRKGEKKDANGRRGDGDGEDGRYLIIEDTGRIPYQKSRGTP